MPLTPAKRERLERYFDAIRPMQEAYQHVTFAFVALANDSEMVLMKGAVFMTAQPPVVPFSHFKSANVFAGHYSLADLGLDLRGFIEQALTGTIQTPDGAIKFRNLTEEGHQIRHDTSHTLSNRERLDTLTIIGGRPSDVGHVGLEWELRAHSTPYEDLNEMLSTYDLGQRDGHGSSILVIPFGVLFVDALSKVEDTNAQVVVRAADGLDVTKVSVGYRAMINRRCVQRGSVRSEELKWESSDGVQLGRVEIEVPLASMVDCILCFDGQVRQRWWIFDLTRAQNPRKAVYEEVDPSLEVLRDYLSRAGKSTRDAKDFEAGVGLLLWMLGFGPAYLGNHKSLHWADIAATTARGHFAVVECTTGLLKAENKMARVVERAERTRRRLDGTPFRVLPVMITSKPRNEVKADLEAAEKLGVLVVAQEELQHAVEILSHQMPDADAIFEQSEKRVR